MEMNILQIRYKTERKKCSGVDWQTILKRSLVIGRLKPHFRQYRRTDLKRNKKVSYVNHSYLKIILSKLKKNGNEQSLENFHLLIHQYGSGIPALQKWWRLSQVALVSLKADLKGTVEYYYTIASYITFQFLLCLYAKRTATRISEISYRPLIYFLFELNKYHGQ